MTTEHEIARQAYSKARTPLRQLNADIARLEIEAWNTDDETRLTESAEAYLANGEQVSSLLPKLEELRSERLVVERAVDIARAKFYATKESKNREVVAALRPAHREAAARVAAAVIQLAEANAAEAKIRQRAPAAGLPFLSFPGVDLGSPDSQASHFLKFLQRTYSIKPAPRMEAAE